MKRVEGKVAFVTGAARGQGREHCVRLASEGAKIIAVDVCAGIPTAPYPGASSEDMRRTIEMVDAAGGEVESSVVDVRDLAGLQEAVGAGVERFGRLDIVVANAGIVSYGKLWELTEEQWETTIDVDLSGVWRTIRAAVPAMLDADNGGSVVITSSTAGLRGQPHIGHYAAAKHGVIGLMRVLAIELAPFGIRVNALAPTNVRTDMLYNTGVYKMFCPGVENPTEDDAFSAFEDLHLLKLPCIEPSDVSNALLFLASEEGRYLTGTTLPIDLGLLTN